jgi:tRNA(Ile)-lysidine synthase
LARSHPPTLIKLAQRTLREECGLERGMRVLVAVSGGPDSMALLDVLAHLRSKLGFELVAHGVDHGLRAEAAGELALAAERARELDVTFERSELELGPGGNLQARARAARYLALESAMARHEATLLATAHHADDRAETVLLRLLRGAGPRGLAVLPARAGQRIRPFLRARRLDVLAHLERHGIPFAVDPSNQNRRFQRVRVRLELMPLLLELSPGVVGHLNALADALCLGDELAALQASAAAQNVPLGRAHQLALGRARRLGQRQAAVRLPGGWEARVDFSTGDLRLDLAARGQRR